MNLPSWALANVNTASTVIGVPFILALLSLQAECRLPPKILMLGVEKALYGGDKGFSGRIGIDQSLSRKEAYRGRRRRKRRPAVNYIHTFGYPKKPRSRPRRPPPPVQEFPEEFEEIMEEPVFVEERPMRSRPWSNHLYSASIRSREPSRFRPDFYPNFRGKKPRPPFGGVTYHSREPEESDGRWNEYRDEFIGRNPDWEIEDSPWESDRINERGRDEYKKYVGKSPPWRDNREVLRIQNFKSPFLQSQDTREIVQPPKIPSYQIWSEKPDQQDDIEVQVKYPVWMEDTKPPDEWLDELYPGQRTKKYPQDIRPGKLRPGINQDLESHILQPEKKKTKFRSGIGQHLRGPIKDASWDLDALYQNQKNMEINWQEPKPFEQSDVSWADSNSNKNTFWSQKKTSVNEGQWEDSQSTYNKDFPWSETTSASNQDYWTDSTTSSSRPYPHWDNTQQYYHDRSLRQPAAQSKMDTAVDGHQTDAETKPAGSEK